jgi:transcriptional regulator with XRE-family HTH domain
MCFFKGLVTLFLRDTMLGIRIKQSRERLGWSQNELARRAGVPQPLLSQLEAGQRHSMTTENAKRVARALGVGVDYLIGTWEDETAPSPAPAVAQGGAEVLPVRRRGRPRKAATAVANS